MNLNTILKREGIEYINKLDTLTVNSIAKSIAHKLCIRFSRYGLDESHLFSLIANISMYTAHMPNDLSCAKYVCNHNSIIFSDNLNLDEMCSLAIHECIHFIQETKNSKKYSNKLGLHIDKHGIAINEASVQFMASLADNKKEENVMYYDVHFNTISPNYYPLQCCLLNQIMYFTESDSLFHSTLNGNSLFKDSFIAKTSKKIYNDVVNNFDLLLEYEEELNFFMSELQYANSNKEILFLNNIIRKCKTKISNLFFKTQNLIMENFFRKAFDNCNNIDELMSYKHKLYHYKDLIGYNENYTFYNEFYCKCMSEIENQKLKLENISLTETSLILVNSKISYFNRARKIIFNLFKLNKNNINISKNRLEI